MIQGQFGDNVQLFCEIDLITSDGLNLPVDVMLDTGFTGFMAINKQDLESLDLAYIGKETLRTAQVKPC
jgi:predicted aspartyl protease